MATPIASPRNGDDHKSARPVPRLAPKHLLLGHLLAFRDDRIGLQLEVGKNEGDIVQARFGFVPVVLVTSPALAHEVLMTKNASFVKSPGLAIFLRPVLGNGLLTSEHGTHAQHRKMIAPAFAHKRVASYATTMAERSARVAAAVPDGTVLDASELLMQLTLEIVGKTLFDAEVRDTAKEVGDAVTTAMECTFAQLGSVLPIPPFVPTPTNLRSRRAVATLDSIVYGIIRKRRESTEDRGDLLSILLETKYEDGSTMTDKQVRDEAMTLFLAGHETTANALAWTLYLLAKHPEARARLEAEVDALGHVPSYEDLEQLPWTLAVLKETMRLYPPAYTIARRVSEDVVLGGFTVKKNVLVVINVLGLHRRPDIFPDPERFDPERFLGDAEKKLPRGAYIPFGSGPRVCIGNHFALMEGHVVLASLLKRLRFDLASDKPVELEPLVTLRPKGGMPMRVTVREPSA
ncbi:MAG: cytochrome [Labilithrix sp.]|nr:cytochrome [Labilithrix sp.]